MTEHEKTEEEKRAAVAVAALDYRRGHADGFEMGISWGYVIGIGVGALVVWALRKEGVTWLL